MVYSEPSNSTFFPADLLHAGDVLRLQQVHSRSAPAVSESACKCDHRAIPWHTDSHLAEASILMLL